MDEELRELIELARIDAEYARHEIGRLPSTIAKPALTHVEGVIMRLDEFLKRTHWSSANMGSKKN